MMLLFVVVVCCCLLLFVVVAVVVVVFAAVVFAVAVLSSLFSLMTFFDNLTRGRTSQKTNRNDIFAKTVSLTQAALHVDGHFISTQSGPFESTKILACLCSLKWNILPSI